MVFLRAFFRGIMLLVILVSVALWVVAGTLQMTLFNRDAVKQWARGSGAYENIVDTIEIRQVDATGIVTSDMLRKAIDAVITPAYIQKHTETVIDVAYDWLEGKAPEITYSIPIHEQQTEFIRELGVLLQEKIRTLPQCSGSVSLSEPCVPRAYTLETYAASVAKQTAEDSDLFEKPITSDAVDVINTLKQLPMFVSLSAAALWILPIVIVLFGTGYVALSRKWRQGVVNLGKRLVFSSATLVVIGALAWVFGASLDLGARLFGGSDAAIVTAVVEPILQQAVVSIGMWLTIFSGSVVVTGAVLWLVGYILQRRDDKGSSDGKMPVTKPVSRLPSTPAAPQASAVRNRPPTPRKPMSF
jgi:hypothetical protein